ncbi:uncharacterized protein LOC118184800 [Stegodyphus dumicola]|uniref:uncharacterized protein LOC118184800 n=1 Tax=Stegodyphus dumicola TaxID=202533 RepID=UPI0015AA24BF|nr:uncharacterized protein LOC118184800 [Stegodyphus dumicola]
MQSNEDDLETVRSNLTDDRGRSRSPATTKFPPYFVPRRPRVIKMRDLSPATRNMLTKEYYDAYDPWTGIRIAATLGILISLFTLFLIYKSRFNKSKNVLLPSKKTSLYLYDDDIADGDLGSLGSSDHSSVLGYPFTYNKNSAVDRMGFHIPEGFQLEEVLVKSSLVECVALKVHPSAKKTSKGPKFGTLRITEDASRSLPCSPYKQQQQASPNTDVKVPHSPTYSTDPLSLVGSITSFGSTDTSDSGRKQGNKETITKNVLKSPRRASASAEVGKSCPKSLVVTAKKPQDYRSRSTVVAIARRKRTS